VIEARRGNLPVPPDPLHRSASRTGRLAAGPWLRLCAVGATAAAAATVASGSLGIAHSALAALALPPLVALVIAAWRAHRRLLPWTLAALGSFLVAIGTWWAGTVHVAAAAVALAVIATATVQLFRGEQVPAASWRDYVTLTKPRIMSLLLLTGVCGMFVGAGGVPPVVDIVVLLVGLALACGGASALNHVLDADIDKLMGKRTRSRPVATGRIAPERALEFGLALSALSFVLLASFANVLTAVLALVGNLFYVLVYTRWLKRTTPQNIVIGGAAGAVPPLVGWAAATGDLTLPALALFAIVFFWTPPHFWALALLIKRDYQAAGIPMLPVVRGERETVRQIIAYTLVLIAVTLVPVAFGMFGAVYLIAASVLGAAFLWLAWRLRRELVPARASALFHYSLAYLAVLFIVMAVDPLLA